MTRRKAVVAACLALLAASSRAAKPAFDPASLRRSTEPITIVSPGPAESLPFLRNKWVMGSVSTPTAKFEINGQAVEVHPGGGFLAFLPVQAGTFTFNCVLAQNGSTATYARSVFISSPTAMLAGRKLEIDPTSLWPSADMDLRPGEWALARMKATPGQKGFFRFSRRAWLPMKEIDPALGTYEGVYVVKPGESADPAPLEYRVGTGWKAAEAHSAGKVTLDPGTLAIAMVKDANPVNIYSNPGEGPFLVAFPQTSLIINGRSGGASRVALSGGQVGWIDTKFLDFQPNVIPPHPATDTVGVKNGDAGGVSVNIGLTERAPFSIEEADDLHSLTVRLHYTAVHTNWIVYSSTDDFVKEVRVKQEGAGVTAVTIRLNPDRSLWGYHASYSGRSLRVEVRPAPTLARSGSPLSGLRVIVDPGHMPSASGRFGPLGTTEMDANYAIAKAVEKLLLAEGAKPVMTRTSPSDEVGLADRARIAWENKGDLFISVHNNGLNDAENPFPMHGYQIFYYHPHSLALGQAVYRSYQRESKLRDEKLRFGDYLVVRIPEMPSVLTESAYMNYPDQEVLLSDPEYQLGMAKTIVSGIKSFLDDERARQRTRRKP